MLARYTFGLMNIRSAEPRAMTGRFQPVRSFKMRNTDQQKTKV